MGDGAPFCGTGAPPPSSLPFPAVQNAGPLEWLEHGLLDVIMGSGAYVANFELGELLGADQHFRLQPATSGPGYAADPAMDDVSALTAGTLSTPSQASRPAAARARTFFPSGAATARGRMAWKR